MEAKVWQAAVRSASVGQIKWTMRLSRVVRYGGLVLHVSVATRLDWQESNSSFADACSEAKLGVSERWRCESCRDLMT